MGIDQRRDAAVSMTVGDETDDSAICEMMVVNDRMHLIKERGIWLVQLADEIDPDRTNDKVPNTQQKLLARGALDPLVQRTLLQAKVFLSPSFLPGVDTPRGLAITLGFLQEIAALQDLANSFRASLEAANEAFLRSKATDGTLKVPSLRDVASRGKAFIQGADHCARPLCDLASLFYPDVRMGGDWVDKLTRHVANERFANRLCEFEKGRKFLRNTRNAVEHPKPKQKVVFTDYHLNCDGTLTPPTVEVVHNQTSQPETDLAGMFQSLIDFLVQAYEDFLVILCALNVESQGAFAIRVSELETRQYPNLRYGYVTEMGGRWHPIS